MKEKVRELSNGVKIPVVGFGTYKLENDNDEVCNMVKEAIKAGYRSIDTASFYDNEEGVGKGITQSGINREELFITTKVWPDDDGYENTMKAFEKSLSKLNLDYIDLYLVHWPTEKIKELFINKYNIKKNINVIPTGIDIDKFSLNNKMKENITKIKAKYHLSDDDFIIGSVGRIAPEKSFDKLISTMTTLVKENKNIKLMLVGGGPDIDNLKE